MLARGLMSQEITNFSLRFFFIPRSFMCIQRFFNGFIERLQTGRNPLISNIGMKITLP